ncbi:MAG: hypothetical protein IKF82_01230 [Bacilli bacterium]|nr:hypothetical protein [Bacilli bacterium]
MKRTILTTIACFIFIISMVSCKKSITKVRYVEEDKSFLKYNDDGSTNALSDEDKKDIFSMATAGEDIFVKTQDGLLCFSLNRITDNNTTFIYSYFYITKDKKIEMYLTITNNLGNCNLQMEAYNL